MKVLVQTNKPTITGGTKIVHYEISEQDAKDLRVPYDIGFWRIKSFRSEKML